jgi:AraC family transcriptional regulator
MVMSRSQPRARTVGGVTLRLLPPVPYCVRYTPARPVAGFAFDAQQGVHAFASDRVQPFRAIANSLAFTPAGCSVYSEAREGGEYLTVSGDEKALSALLPDEDVALPTERFTGRIGPAGAEAAGRLRRLLLGGASEPAALEAAVADFLGAICRCGGAYWRPRGARSLTARRLRIVDELIEARLGQPLSIAEMAAACGLSAGFFLRSFRAATGQTPHRYLMERRISRARRLLAECDDPAAAIALGTGFASQAHMTAAFTRALGVAPAGYRKIVRQNDSCATIYR